MSHATQHQPGSHYSNEVEGLKENDPGGYWWGEKLGWRMGCRLHTLPPTSPGEPPQERETGGSQRANCPDRWARKEVGEEHSAAQLTLHVCAPPVRKVDAGCPLQSGAKE